MRTKTKQFYCHFAVLILFLSLSINSFAQGRLGYLVGTGILYYNGDLNEKSDKIISNNKVFKPYFRTGINYRLNNRIEASLAFLHGNVAAADSIASELDNKLRNQSFRSVINEFSLQVEYHLLSVYSKNRLNPFIFLGAGLFQFNPQAQLNGVYYDLQPLGTEGQNLGGNYQQPYKLIQISFPVGAGIYFQLNENWRLRIEYTHHFTRTDYLDDVSNGYPDLNALANQPNGDLAVALSNRRKDGEPAIGRSRGNAKYKDSFSQFGVTLIYNPGKLSFGKPYKRHHYKNLNMKRLLKGRTCQLW